MKTNFKRIIAATTLAAMALTGNVVNILAVAEEAEVVIENINGEEVLQKKSPPRAWTRSWKKPTWP